MIGAGLIGQTHIETLKRTPGAHLSAIVEPSPRGAEVAAAEDVPYFADIEAFLAAGGAAGAIVATPNATHGPVTAALLCAGVPVLLEKPVAESLEAALALIAVADAAGLPVLVGHQRRHNPLTKAAFAAISSGAIGELVMATVTTSLAKPAPYFDMAWRKEPGSGGPLLINMVHEIDLLRHFFGEIASVQALVSHERRGLPVEDSAAVCLSFARGGMATLCISDAATGPWAWDITAGENPSRFPAHPVSAHLYAGTKAGLSLPDLTLWQPPGGRPDWMVELAPGKLPYTPGDPYIEQIQHFVGLIQNGGAPLVSLRDATANLIVLDAIAKAAASGQRVEVDLTSLDAS